MRKLFGALALAVSVGLPASANAGLQRLDNLFVFGDSLSDGGNSGLISATVDPPGVVYPPWPYSEGRYSNGKVAVEYLWNRYHPGDNSFKPSLAGGTNYAVGGATTGETSFNSSPASSVPGFLRPAYVGTSNAGQLERFLAMPPTFDPATSLFTVWLFPNDVFNWLTSGMLPGTAVGGGPPVPGDAAALVGNGVQNIVDTVLALAGAGAQHFLVPNLPDLGSIPGAGTGGNPDLTQLSVTFNAVLAGALSLVDSALPSVEIAQFDTFSFFTRVRQNPGAYGFANATDACLAVPTDPTTWCSDPDKYVFWDSVHPTTRAHEVLGAQFYALVPEPSTFALLAIALFGICPLRQRKSR